MPVQPYQVSIASEMVAAALGGAISSFTLFPLEVVKTKMQAVERADLLDQPDDDKKKKDDDRHLHHNVFAFGKEVYRQEGFSVFYHGFQCSAFQSALEKALYFLFYTVLKQAHHRLVTHRSNRDYDDDYRLDTATNLVLGYAAEWAHLPLTLPIDAWTTVIQTTEQKSSGDEKNRPKKQSSLKILLAMLADPNRSFYRGITAYFLLCLKPALQYTVYEQVKIVWLRSRPRSVLSTLEAFLLGMLARSIATIIIFPFFRAKVILQAKRHGDAKERRRSTPPRRRRTSRTRSSNHATTAVAATGSTSTMGGVLWKQYRTQGLPGLFHGLGPEITRGALSAAIMLAIKERLAFFVHTVMLHHDMTSTSIPDL